MFEYRDFPNSLIFASSVALIRNNSGLLFITLAPHISCRTLAVSQIMARL